MSISHSTDFHLIYNIRYYIYVCVCMYVHYIYNNKKYNIGHVVKMLVSAYRDRWYEHWLHQYVIVMGRFNLNYQVFLWNRKKLI